VSTGSVANDGRETRAQAQDSFWREAFTIRGSTSPLVFGEVLIFTLISLGVCALNAVIPPELGIDVGPFEVAGAALGLLLVFRTNGGYDRWWEGRKLWGAIVNQSRELALTALVHGPKEPSWRDRVVRWTAAFAHVTRRTLRRERDIPEVDSLLGPDEAAWIAGARHMPTAVSFRIAALLREACEKSGMDRFAFLTAEQSRNSLIDSLGGCERILKSPLPKVYGINMRRLIVLYLATLPFALLPKIGWLTPLVTFLVAYPILALDQIGMELQNPFSVKNLGHLPLDDICATIEGDLLALLDSSFRPEDRGDKLVKADG
jgi:putative membrane protein